MKNRIEIINTIPEVDFFSLYQRVYGDVNNFKILTLNRCLSPSWDVALHLVEQDYVDKPFYLNEIGFSCVCFLVNRDELSRYEKKRISFIGPFQDKKQINGKVKEFNFGFIHAPSSYLLEFYFE